MHPHPALSLVPVSTNTPAVSEHPEQEVEYRQLLVQGALAILLPTEDLENPCLRTLVADVLAESILGNAVGGKVCEAWFIWDSITKLVQVVKAKVEPRATAQQLKSDTRSRLEKFGLLADKRKEEKISQAVTSHPTFASTFWRLLQIGYLIFILVRFVMLGLKAARSQPPRCLRVSDTPVVNEPPPIDKAVEAHLQPPRPILSFRMFPLVSALLNLPSRMPWLNGSVELLQHQVMHGAVRIGATNGILDQ